MVTTELPVTKLHFKLVGIVMDVNVGLYETHGKQLEAAEMRFLKRILQISLTERIANENGVERSLLRTIIRRQLECWDT